MLVVNGMSLEALIQNIAPFMSSSHHTTTAVDCQLRKWWKHSESADLSQDKSGPDPKSELQIQMTVKI